MIKIYTLEESVDLLKEDGWDFPFEEIGYLLEEHNGEAFMVDGGRLWELDDDKALYLW